MPSSRQLAVISLAALAIYYEIYRWIPLGRWNWQFRFPVVNDQFYPDIVIGLLLVWFIWSFARGTRPGIYCAAILLPLWAVVHLFDWWIPYLRSDPRNFARFSFYQPHTQMLPVIGHHYPPDAGHTILDAFVFPACGLVLNAIFTRHLSQERA